MPSSWAARPLLERLAAECRLSSGAKPALFVWGMKDFAFKPGPVAAPDARGVPRSCPGRAADAKHFIQEDAPDEIAAAIIERFG